MLVGRCFQNLCPAPTQPQRAEAGLSVNGWEGEGLLPANHLPVPVHGDVRPGPVVIRSKVTVGGSKPLIKSMPQGVELRPVAQMPRNRNPGHFTEPHMGTPQSSEQQYPINFTEHLMKQGPSSTPSMLSLGTAGPHPPGDIRTTHPPLAMLPGSQTGTVPGLVQGMTRRKCGNVTTAKLFGNPGALQALATRCRCPLNPREALAGLILHSHPSMLLPLGGT